mmetsp:Transcript_33737/g.48843  ORF Transcript_33737/g.48843 Transcript_33737/m.48843 type:complete len:601 (-) Transcript_33737:319-2121(-)|eukprot:CAMPEP_0116025346 /NCGR_PEP_ID=MMETSP0321-20121206/12979_1 /TAXON_ID=163516 /ORGANISM="Leptocylindrus danicus var. danicus, Strain B650" /LENGTH=600 /DNA_ID=CAMNT_0003497493 /DNA_START=427 /DNA_END=2229 /DNA_ORIENTATION=-
MSSIEEQGGGGEEVSKLPTVEATIDVATNNLSYSWNNMSEQALAQLSNSNAMGESASASSSSFAAPSTVKSVLDQSEEVMKFYHMQMEQQAARHQAQAAPTTVTQQQQHQLQDQVKQAELLSQLQNQIIQQQQQIGQLRALNAANTSNNPQQQVQQQYAQNQYASLGSLRAQDLCRMQLNSPTINAASALLAAASPPALVMPPVIPPPNAANASNAINGGDVDDDTNDVTSANVGAGKNVKSKNNVQSSEKKRVPHVYHDYGQVPDNNFVRKKTGGVTQPFPEKLMEMLDKEGGRNAHIVCWLPHGRAFIVRKPQEFTTVIMSRYFRQTKITSFQRQLNLYGFRRITQGADAGAYYHEMFLRGRPNLCTRMVRTKVKGTGHKQPSDVRSEPNFYSMPHQPEVNTGIAMTETSSHHQYQLQSHETSSSSNGGGTIPFSPHLHGAANLLTGFAQGAVANTSNAALASMPPLSLDQRTFYSAAGALTGLNNVNVAAAVVKSNPNEAAPTTAMTIHDPATTSVVAADQSADSGGSGGGNGSAPLASDEAAENSDFAFPRQQHSEVQQPQQQQEHLKTCEASRSSSMGAVVHKSESFEKLCITSV